MHLTRRSFLASPLVLAMLAPARSLVVAQGVSGLAVGFEPVLTGLSRPVGYVDANDGSGRFFVVEQDGRVLVSVGGELLDTPFLDISSSISTGNEQGLLGFALDPEFSANGRVFVSYTDVQGNSQIVRYEVNADDPNRLDPDSAVSIFTLEQPYPNHNGGQIDFGPDGMLYLGFGDGGSQGDPNGFALDPGSLYGKILRIDVSGDEEPYGIPADNPYIDDPGFASETFAWGFRNPWRFSFDRETGDLWIGDVGQSWIEEIDLVPAGTSGQNFGWSAMEGTDCYNDPTCDPAAFTGPIVQYTHDYGCAVTGGYVYRGSVIPELASTYLFADYCSGYLWGLVPNGDGSYTSTEPIQTGMNVSSFAEDAGGELYLIDLNGAVYRIVSG